MEIIKTIFALMVIVISVYGLITKDFSYAPVSSFLLGLLIAIIGIEELKRKGKNSWGMVLISTSLFVIMVALISL